jgi:cellulose synthase/poly-beta-1,6-N-acetylglucosamine synthase-like glycosyltransferase
MERRVQYLFLLDSVYKFFSLFIIKIYTLSYYMLMLECMFKSLIKLNFYEIGNYLKVLFSFLKVQLMTRLLIPIPKTRNS